MACDNCKKNKPVFDCSMLNEWIGREVCKDFKVICKDCIPLFYDGLTYEDLRKKGEEDLLSLLKTERNKGVIATVAWALKNRDKSVSAVDLARAVKIAVPTARVALHKLNGKILKVQKYGKTRVYSVDVDKLSDMLARNGLCFIVVENRKDMA